MAETTVSRSDAPVPSIAAATVSRSDAPMRNSYDVFINHRGPDVTKSFVDHLSASFESQGVRAFFDCKDLHVGEDTWDAIESTIRNSKVHICIFSPLYAESPWCLRELQEILECRISSDLFLPVFFNVAPSDLRHSSSPKSCYSSAFAKLLRRNDPKVIEIWRDALCQASLVTGLTLDGAAQGFEARLVKLIVFQVLDVLSRFTPLDIAKYPVGVNEKVQEALGLMQMDWVQNGAHILGIHGMGGVGKTTLAKSIYNRIFREFECFCFVENVRSAIATDPYGLRGVQEGMLRALLKTEDIRVTSVSHGKQVMRDRLSSRIKILLILDDLDDREQLEALVSPLEFCCLKDGSQIVITTRDKQILIWAKAQQMLVMEGLSEVDAHALFNWHAFLHPGEPPKDFKALAKKVVDACQGLPLALETLGSHLYGRDKDFWEAMVKVLGGNRPTLECANMEVASVLKWVEQKRAANVP